MSCQAVHPRQGLGCSAAHMRVRHMPGTVCARSTLSSRVRCADPQQGELAAAQVAGVGSMPAEDGGGVEQPAAMVGPAAAPGDGMSLATAIRTGATGGGSLAMQPGAVRCLPGFRFVDDLCLPNMHYWLCKASTWCTLVASAPYQQHFGPRNGLSAALAVKWAQTLPIQSSIKLTAHSSPARGSCTT